MLNAFLSAKKGVFLRLVEYFNTCDDSRTKSILRKPPASECVFYANTTLHFTRTKIKGALFMQIKQRAKLFTVLRFCAKLFLWLANVIFALPIAIIQCFLHDFKRRYL